MASHHYTEQKCLIAWTGDRFNDDELPICEIVNYAYEWIEETLFFAFICFYQVTLNWFVIVVWGKLCISFGSSSIVFVVAHYHGEIHFLKRILSNSASTNMMYLYYCLTRLRTAEYLILPGFLLFHYLTLIEYGVLAMLQHNLKSGRTKYFTTSRCESMLGY